MCVEQVNTFLYTTTKLWHTNKYHKNYLCNASTTYIKLYWLWSNPFLSRYYNIWALSQSAMLLLKQMKGITRMSCNIWLIMYYNSKRNRNIDHITCSLSTITAVLVQRIHTSNSIASGLVTIGINGKQTQPAHTNI